MRLRRPQFSRCSGFTLVELMFAVGLLAFLASAIVYCFLVMNKATARSRDLSSAKALCQEMIDTCLSIPYSPSAKTIPGLLVSGATTSDTVSIYLREDNSTVVVSGTRSVATGTADTATLLLKVTVKVTYRYRNVDFVYQMATLRAPD